MNTNRMQKGEYNRRFLAAVCCFGALVVLSGCTPIEKLQQWKTVQVETIKGANQPVSGKVGYVMNQGKGQGETGAAPQSPSRSSAGAGETVAVTLYFADEKGEGLTAEQRTIVKEEGIARATVKALLQGPQKEGLKAVVPVGTVLRDINLKENGCCVVDFNKAITEGQTKEETAEMLTVASIVQTLGQFPAVKEVQILVEGRVISTLGGRIDVSVPIPTKNQKT